MNATDTIERPPTAIAEYSPTAAALADLRTRLGNVAYDLSTGKGMDIAKKDRAEVRGLRVALEAKRVELKAPALERSRLIDAEAKALTAELVALEQPIDAQIKAEEGRKAAEKAAKEQAEREAAAKVQTRFDDLRDVVGLMVGKASNVIACTYNEVAKFTPTLEDFGDRAGEAAQAKVQVLAKLEEMRDTAEAHEAEQARMEAERQELARQRAEQEARDKAERERLAAEQKAAAAALAAQRAAFEAEQAQARAEAKAREDADRARRDEEDRKAREARAAEDKRIADARAELEAQQRAIREAEEAKAAVARKAEQAAADATAAAERKRLDDEAAAARAEQQRIADEARAEQQRKGEERERLEAASRRVRDAAPALLVALRAMVHKATKQNWNDQYPDELAQAYAAIEEATGEPQ